jgi:hypothetical protein
MSNVKAQSPNKIQNPNVKDSLNLEFDIHLTFACLREAASAKAGILKFDIHETLFPPAAMGSFFYSPSHVGYPLL